MKKCPRCLKYDRDDVRFCCHCNTELFFEHRFKNCENPKKFLLSPTNFYAIIRLLCKKL